MNFLFPWQDVGLWLEEINLGSYRQVFKENGVNGEYLEGMSMFTTEQILRFIRRCHMKWGDFITLCKELRRIKGISHLSFSLPRPKYCNTCIIFWCTRMVKVPINKIKWSDTSVYIYWNIIFLEIGGSYVTND